MVRMCKVIGCNVREGQGKQLFRFPKDPERRSIWVSRTGRRFWHPRCSSCICEDHFDAPQWEAVREDGSKMLRRLAVPMPAENSENISLTMHDHGYAVGTNQRYLFQNLAQMNRLSHDHGYALVQSKPSKLIQAAESQVIAKKSNIAVECATLQHCSNDNFNPLSISADTCAASEPVCVSQSTASPASIKIQKLQDQVEKQEKKIKALQHDNKRLNTIAEKAIKQFYTVKSAYNKCRFKLWRLEQSKPKSFTLTSRLRADQIASLERRSSRGLKWSPETIKDALMFKMKWGTTGFSDFVNYLPIFPSVRTLQRTIEHIQFKNGVLDEIFDSSMQQKASENERNC